MKIRGDLKLKISTWLASGTTPLLCQQTWGSDRWRPEFELSHFPMKHLITSFTTTLFLEVKICDQHLVLVLVKKSENIAIIIIDQLHLIGCSHWVQTTPVTGISPVLHNWSSSMILFYSSANVCTLSFCPNKAESKDLCHNFITAILYVCCKNMNIVNSISITSDL